MLFNNNQIIILYILITICIFIVINGYYKNNAFYIKYDILSKNYNFTNIKLLNNYLDGWALSHFMLFFILTYIYPSEWKFLIIVGIIWEIIEYILSIKKYHHIFNYIYNYKYDAVFWYARYEDIIMNILGIITAFTILKIIK